MPNGARSHPTPMRLEALLADPALGLELVAGRAGVRERGPIRWATSSDLPDPTPWMEGGEVLLTTGLGVRDDPATQRRLVAALDRRGVTAIGFGVGVIVDDVPPTMLAEADVRRLPLFTVPYEVPFIAVAKRVSQHIFGEHYATLRSAVDLHRQVLAAVLAGAGVAGVLETVLRPMPGATAVAFDYYGQVLARHDDAGLLGSAAVDTLWAAVVTRRHERQRFEVDLGGHVATGMWLRVADALEAAFVLVASRPLHDAEALLFEQGLTGLSLELARGLSIREAHRARVDEVLEEVATGRVSRDALARRLQRLGFDASAAFGVLCVAPPARGAVVRDLCALVEDAVAGALVGQRDGLAYALVQPPGEQGEQVRAAAAARGLLDVQIGCTGAVEGLDRLAPAFAEACAAATAPGAGGVRDVGSLGLPGLIAGLAEESAARSFVARVVGPVLAHDDAEGTALADSLRAYLRHGCRPGPAAAELCVHRHTLSYRLDRIEQLTGRDPRDGRHLLEFGLALELAARASAR